jgi:hypothetical protein
VAKNFYEGKQANILKSFNRQYECAREYLVQRFDESTASKIHDDAIEQVRKLIPQLPDVGGKNNQFIPVVLFCAWYIPFYKAASKQGMSADEYVKMMTHVVHAAFTRYPRFIRHLGGKLVQSGLFMRRMKKHAAISQRREYSKDWIYSVSTETDDPDIFFEVEYSQCTVCILMKETGAEGLMPYCNFVDYIMAKSLGYGFENPRVIGRGDETCVGIFRKDNKCEIPDYLEFAFEGLRFCKK